MEHVDTLVIGAGAAGLFCAGSIIQAAGKGQEQRVLVLDHARAAGEKIRISGGGRCNFTNLAANRERFLSQNPRFCASALSGFSPQDFVEMVNRAGIAWHEKTLGQLFCDDSARQIIDMLLHRMRGAELWLETAVQSVEASDSGYLVRTSRGVVSARNLVVAAGGRSIPKMGATGLGYELAEQFGLRIIEPRAGLVPLTFATQDLDLCRPLAGVAVDAVVSHGQGRSATRFRDGLLFTHRGLSGPAILQISSFWKPGDEITVDLAPDQDIAAAMRDMRGQNGRQAVSTALARYLPSRLADAITEELGFSGARLADQANPKLDRIAERVNRWRLRPVGSEGWRTAEVTLGGVDTRDLDARTMQARNQAGLYFIGEVVDVTGWLGGYNFQWAWASAHAAAKSIAAAEA
ncbi:NAD(P)/FAD-dependent oxidoreductase [Paracoccus aestuariivivens]|uniref:Aminoacetone oxidase family FAD-binding enzyme n=1 Tax=Paracoccus aestuariivivens TaxID=1820333 RepID=A0A6L6JDR6_9RHOB|nr:NAD(P)/FAD-dependent oxidoreductase [Paracoccus aestuariivivens]MTH79338.1 aminoacetone oxidase family FAD-binding enzyme [Paracoccus aestuariivivens]